MRNTFAYVWQFILYYKYEVLCITLSIVTLIGAVGVLVYDAGPLPTATDDYSNLLTSSSTQASPQASGLFVDVSGAVKKAGMYELSPGARVADAITKAGGLAADVDMRYFSQNINLAKTLKDEEKLYIPLIGEQDRIDPVDSLLTTAETYKINVNTATQAQLESLPGVGAVTAKKIISARPITDIQTLTDEKIISASVFSKIEQLIRL